MIEGSPAARVWCAGRIGGWIRGRLEMRVDLGSRGSLWWVVDLDPESAFKYACGSGIEDLEMERREHLSTQFRLHRRWSQKVGLVPLPC